MNFRFHVEQLIYKKEMYMYLKKSKNRKEAGPLTGVSIVEWQLMQSQVKRTPKTARHPKSHLTG